ncbi:MAG: hypothetical protein HY519_04490 [Candidatus Aenigmarchaeota archaeon]|nr:hypothetical protein [Candidatus Aenigmarchaeota archaeon]
MQDIIIIRYSEIGLKSKQVRRKLERLLAGNIKAAFAQAGNDCSLRRGYGRIYLRADAAAARRILPYVFGISSYSVCQAAAANMEAITALAAIAAKRIGKDNTFKVAATRAGVHSFTSMDINRQAGRVIEQQTGARVNLSRPDLTVSIEVRDKEAYVYTEKKECGRGLPLGSQGTVLAVIRNRKDAIACWLMMRRGCLPTLAFCCTPAQEKTLYSLLANWAPGTKLETERLPAIDLAGTKGVAARHGAIALCSATTLPFSKEDIGLPCFNPLALWKKADISLFLRQPGKLT